MEVMKLSSTYDKDSDSRSEFVLSTLHMLGGGLEIAL